MSERRDDRLVELGLLPATVVLTCRASQAAGRATRHPVTIRADWTVDTGHDIDSERLAAALGGRISCLDLVDHVDYTVPAARQWLLANLRIGIPGITSTDGRRWRPVKRAKCCPRTGFADPAKAADHVRSPRHIATQLAAPSRHLAAVIRHWTPLLAQQTPPTTDRRSRYLYDCGLTPETVLDVERQLDADVPLPTDLHLALMTMQPDLTWFRRAMAAMPSDALTPTWVAWQSRRWEQIPVSERLEWLSLPIPARLALALTCARASPRDIHRLAEAQNCTLTRAAKQLASWTEAGLHPTVDDLLELVGSDRGQLTAPSMGAVARAKKRCSSLQPHSDLTVALALAKHGDASGAADGLARADLLTR